MYKRVRGRSSQHAPQSVTKIDITNAIILPMNNDNYYAWMITYDPLS